MAITPLEIQQKRFRTAFTGYDRNEVETFLTLVASDVEDLVRRLQEAEAETVRQRRLIEEYRGREQAIKETMITAQRVTEEITGTARREADVILSRAELEADRLVEGAQARLTQVLGDIAEAKRQRGQFTAQIRGVVEAHVKLLKLAEAHEDQPQVEDKLAVMRRPASWTTARHAEGEVAELPRSIPANR